MNYITKPERFLLKEEIKIIEDIAYFHNQYANFSNSVKNTFVMSDIHGMKNEFLKLLQYITKNKKSEEFQYPNRFVFLGDYVDRGPDSAGVIAIVRLLEELMPGGFVIPLRGNHEEMSIQELVEYGDLSGPTGRSFKSKGIMKFPNDVTDWLNNLPYYYEDEMHIYVHAGLQPGVPLNKQTNETMIWIREKFLLYNYDFGKHVFHGHTPNFGFERTPTRTNVDTGACFGGVMTACEVKQDQLYPTRAYYVDKNTSRFFELKDR
jgi:serine/threonine protein phosphatase 1